MKMPLPIALLVSLNLISPVQAGDFGRLFFSAEERSHLDQQMLKTRTADTPSSITVNAIIQRSDGRRIVWINGKENDFGPSPVPNIISLNIPGKKHALEISVGEHVTIDRPLAETPAINSAGDTP